MGVDPNGRLIMTRKYPFSGTPWKHKYVYLIVGFKDGKKLVNIVGKIKQKQ